MKCITCKAPNADNGEGWNGECGDCADKTYALETCRECFSDLKQDEVVHCSGCKAELRENSEA